MPIFEFEAPNGKRYQVEAPDEASAKRGFVQMVERSPKLFADPGVSAALKDLENRPYNKNRKRDSTSELIDSYTLGIGRHISGGIDAGITALQRAVPGGEDPDYSPGDAYRASRLLEETKSSEYRARHPLLATTADIAGGLAMPGAKAFGKFVVGKTAPALAAAGKKVGLGTRLAQTGRGSLVAGAQTGALAANTARPGEEVKRGTEGAMVGALLAPAASLAAGAAAKVAPRVLRTGQRLADSMLGNAPRAEPVLTDTARAALRPPGPDVTSREKLIKVLRREGLTPEALVKVEDAWDATGGISPNLIDVLKDAGASPGVLRLLQRSGAQAPARVAADTYARETVEGVQKKALDEVATLPTGEPRTPSQIRADLDKRVAAAEAAQVAERTRITRKADTKTTTVDKRLEKQVGEIDASLAEGRLEPPAGSPKESGGEAFSNDLNAKYDASEQVYKDAYKEAEAAAPELAFIDPADVRPLFAKLESKLAGMNPRLGGVSLVKKELDILKDRVAPGNAADWPEGEVMENAAPLTVQDMEFLRQMMNEIADKVDGKAGQAAALRVKGEIDDELTRLATDNRIAGDPTVVDKWRTAILGAAEHKAKFGSGLAAKLTERTNTGERVVEPWRAGDVIFGTKDKGSRPINTVLSELEAAMEVADPAATEALKRELYGRIPPEKLAELMKSTGGSKLLPKDLTEASLAAQEANRVAEEAAEAARVAATQNAEGRKVGVDINAAEALRQSEAELAAQRATPDAERKALETGEGALKTPSEEFAPAVEGLDTMHLPLAAAGAKQSVLDVIEQPPPEATSVLRGLMGERATRNLGTTLGDENIQAMAARLRNIESQARNAQELGQAVGAGAPHESPLVESIGPYDVINPKRAGADIGLMLARLRERLSPDEYLAAVEMLTRSGRAGLNDILPNLLAKYPAAKRAATPTLVRGAGRESGEEDSLERMRLEYDL